ncbi:FecR family protein [Marinicella gelatinilytica]|uniref:FecR family protein n=1 Tax=Marinicella gelatinilytica TaxID=2996017 RepID=UPI002260CF6C|nr:FecR family protein [Marinicella gelatinilytica]MCX7544701.1 FecR family protein [Marinicella gelatinilytica]
MNKEQADTILKQLKQRTEPDAAKQQATKQAVMAHWQKNLKKQRRQRFAWTAAVAASVIVVFALVLVINFDNGSQGLPAMYQQVDIHGTIMLEQDSHKAQPMTADVSLKPGDIIASSSDGYLIWHLNDGSELRQGPDARIVWQSDQQIELLTGQLFHNTDITQSAEPFMISTKLGSVSHVGTQYVVKHQPNRLQVAVKSGRVNISRQQKQHTVKGNELMSISPDGVESVHTFTGHNHPMWSWTFKTQQPYALKGQSLYDFVVWISQHTDLAVDWQGHQQATQGVLLQGTIDKMSVDMALKTVFASTDYQYQIDQGRLQIINQDK